MHDKDLQNKTTKTTLRTQVRASLASWGCWAIGLFAAEMHIRQRLFTKKGVGRLPVYQQDTGSQKIDRPLTTTQCRCTSEGWAGTDVVVIRGGCELVVVVQWRQFAVRRSRSVHGPVRLALSSAHASSSGVPQPLQVDASADVSRLASVKRLWQTDRHWHNDSSATTTGRLTNCCIQGLF